MSDEKKRLAEARSGQRGLSEIKLTVPSELAKAWQRCTWLLVQEKGQDRLESMEEMVHDFLVKHGC